MRAILLVTAKMIAMIMLTESAYALYASGYPAYQTENKEKIETNTDCKIAYPAYEITQEIKI